MPQYAWKVARQGRRGGGVVNTAAPQPPQLQQFAWSQLSHRASAPVAAIRSLIARQLFDMKTYYSGWYTSRASGHNDCMEECSNEDDGHEEGQSDSSAGDEDDTETKEELDEYLDKKEREKSPAAMPA